MSPYSWAVTAADTRVASRNAVNPGNRYSGLGTRLARTMPVDADGDGFFMYAVTPVVR